MTKIVWHGHLTFSIQHNGVTLLIDPFFDGNPAAKISKDDVKPDFILVSHGHGDHVGDAEYIAKKTGATVISNFEIVTWLQGKGVEKAHPLHIGGGANFPFGRVKMTIAHHGSGLPDGSYGGNPGGFLITFNDGKKVYFAGDTALTYDMTLLADENVDVAILPIGDNFTMGIDDAVKAVKFIQPKVVIPAHYNTWPLIEADPNEFKRRVESETDTKCVVLDVEGTYEF